MKLLHIGLLLFILTMIILILSGCTATGSGGAYAAQQQVAVAEEVGGKLFVACRNLPLHQAAEGYSNTIMLLPFGTQVEVIEALQYYRPDPDKLKSLPAWAQIKTATHQGYVAARCLVTEELFNQQNAIDSASRAKDGFSQQASKGFSEEEEGDLFMMMGGTGQAKGGAADYSMLDQYLTATQEYNPQQAFAAFRQEGKLGEYQ